MPSGYSGAECSCIYKYSLTGICTDISTKTPQMSERASERLFKKIESRVNIISNFYLCVSLITE